MKCKGWIALLVCLSLLMGVTGALAVPAYPGDVTITESASGQSVTIRQIGDEFFSYMTSTDGRLIVEDANGMLRYVVESNGAYQLGGSVTGASLPALQAGASNGSVVSAYADGLRDKLTALNAQIDANRIVPLTATPALIPQNYTFVGDKLERKVKKYTNAEFAQKVKPPLHGSMAGLLVLKIEFTDVQSAFSDAEWHRRLFDDGVSNYYSTVSNNTFTYVPAMENDGTPNDGVITVRMPIEALLYTSDTTTTQNNSNGVTAGLYRGIDNFNYAIYNEGSLFAYAVDQAAQHMDLASYDWNQDGYISPTELAFIMVYSGYETAFCSASFTEGKPGVWAHSWMFNNYINTTRNEDARRLTVIADGVECYKYTLIGENCSTAYDYYTKTGTPRQAQFGTACHELGHDLGLVDLYDTLNQGLKLNVEALSLMAGGNWGCLPGGEAGSSPTHIDAYDKIFLNFYDSRTATGAGTYLLNATEPSSQYNILRINTSDPDIYYLVENRAFVGYDVGMGRTIQSLAPGGVVIWRIDERIIRALWNDNRINCIEGQYGIMPVFLDETMNNQYFMQIPFWGGAYTKLRSSMLLPDDPTMEFSASKKAGSQTSITLSKIPEPVPSTGDHAMPWLWLGIMLAALLGGLTLLLVGRARRAYR